VTAMDAATLDHRREYVNRRNHACYDNGVTPEAFDAACRALLGEGKHPPAAWLRAAERVRFRCGRCAGTGMFVTGVLNGQPTGPGGDCFRCGGRGTQGWRDGRRNRWRDIHQRAY